MNWRRGLFWLWIVAAALFVIVVASTSYNGIKAEFNAAASKPGAATPSILAEFRVQYPEYNGLSDDEIAETVHKRFYSDMPREQFDKKVAEKIAASKTKIVEFRGQLYEFPANLTDEVIGAWLKSTIKNPWASVGWVAGIAFGIPLVVLVLGASIVWAFSGFGAGPKNA